MVSKLTFYYSKIIALIVLSVGSLCLAHGMVTINESTPLRTIIDNHVSNHWKEEKITHQGKCDDSTFLPEVEKDFLERDSALTMSALYSASRRATSAVSSLVDMRDRSLPCVSSLYCSRRSPIV